MTFLTSIAFDIEDQKNFSKFSGDYNPMHIDEISARRFLFGQPVVHGINTVLNALDAWAKTQKCKFYLSNIQCEFLNPVYLNKEVRVKCKKIESTYVLKVLSQDVECSSISFQLKSKHQGTNNPVEDNYPKKEVPIKHTLESIKDSFGEISLNLNQEFLEQTYPNLYRYSDFSQIAALLSSSRIVGMHCPGLNSVYSSFNFNFNNKSLKTRFNLDKINRFGLASIKVSGQYDGKITAFLRPNQVNQSNYSEVKKLVRKDEFKGQSALIIGGSRGIGEVTAKILAAGGADVLITYNKGKEDARKVCEDIKSKGDKISMIYYDINNPSLIEDFKPSDIYYFATPPIFDGKKDKFSVDLFTQFSKYYLAFFHDLVKSYADKEVCNYYYPSSISVEEFPDAMLEYSLSKFSAEKMCKQLEEDNNIKIFKPRLPRLATDQTVSFLPIKNNDTLKYMLDSVKEYNDYKENKSIFSK